MAQHQLAIRTFRSPLLYATLSWLPELAQTSTDEIVGMRSLDYLYIRVERLETAEWKTA
jgi:hypothetical protein